MNRLLYQRTKRNSLSVPTCPANENLKILLKTFWKRFSLASIIICLLPQIALASPKPSFEGMETEMLSLVNKARKAEGLSVLDANWEVARLARYRLEEMIKLQTFGHESPAYGNPREMLNRFNVPFSAIGVNIAMGQETADQTVEAWLGAVGQGDNLLNPSFTEAGVGFLKDENDFLYWAIILIAH